jgi:hypothetical protein
MFSDLSIKLKQLHDEPDTRKSLDIAIEAANEVIKILSPAATDLQYGEDALDKAVPASVFPNHKIENWFAGHPYFADDRVALKFYENDQVETHFYWLGESATKARIAAGTAITPNWEDSELNQKDDSYKVGLDFFLSHDAKSLLVVATNKNNLRVLELEGKLSNTQVDIFKTIRGAFDLPERQQIHRTIWDSLALSEVNKNFYKGIAEHFAILINHFTAENYDKEDSKLFTSRLLGRLLFVWFLRKKSIIDESFGYFDIEGIGSTDYYENSLKKLFFHTLNTPVSDASREDKVTPYLNGGLFEAHDNDWADRTVSFPTGYFKSLFEHLEQYNFTTDESSPEYEQVAIDPEMLGRVFESLLATQLTETGDQARKAKGAFYTPREIVSYMSRESLRQYLYTKLNNPAWNEGVDKLLDTSDSEWELSHSNSKRNLWGEANRNVVPQMVITALDDLKVLDPACGSGAYPMGMLQVILKTYERLESRFDPYATKLRIIEENIYGVDIEPMAVEISRLRAWLSIVVDSNKNPSEFKPLPNLDFKFVVANSLLPLSKDFQLGDDKYDKVRSKMQWVIGKYFNTTDKQEKASLRTEFNKASSSLGQTSLLDVETQLQKQLHSFRPFDVHSEAVFFDPKLMFGLKSKSPFDIVIGNPPYVDYRKIDDYSKSGLINYEISQYSRMINLYTYFFEMGLNSLTEKGVISFISPQQYLIYDNCRGVRDLIRKYSLVSLSDFARAKVFEVGTYPFVTIIKKTKSTDKFAYYEFDNIKDMTSPVRQLNLENPIEEPVNISPYKNILDKIESEGLSIGGSVEAIFVASSSTQTKSNERSEDLYDFVEASNVFEYSFKNIDTYINDKNYSKQSFSRQIDQDIVYTSRMTSKIRAAYSKNNKYLGGKVNVIVPKGNGYYITALLNSKLINFWYREKFSMQHMQGGALPVNAEDLKKIPMPQYDQTLVDGVSEASKDLHVHFDAELRDKVDQLIYQLYKLTPEEIEIIERA